MYKEEQPLRKRSSACELCQKPEGLERIRKQVSEWEILNKFQGKGYAGLPLKSQRDLLNRIHDIVNGLEEHGTHEPVLEELKTLLTRSRNVQTRFHLYGRDMTREEWKVHLYG